MSLFKAIFLTYYFSENSGGKLPEQEALVFQFLLHKFPILFLKYLQKYHFSVYETHLGSLTCPLSNTVGYSIIGFTNWDLCKFSQGDLF